MATNKFSHPGNILIAGFGMMLLAMAILVYFSMKQENSLVSNQYYEQELVYQQRIDASANADLYANRFTLSRSGNRITLQIPEGLSRHIQNGNAYFYCPSDENMDRRETLQHDDSGRYTFDKSLLPGRAYVLKLSFSSGGKNFYKEFNLNW